MSEKAISIVDAEWEALAGLPYLQVRLYLVLRWYMSVATGRVGDERGISLQGLGEELYVDPAPGRSESGSPTRKAVRSALQQLEKHGLIRPCGNGEVLVFFLPKAGSVSARAKTKGHKRGMENGRAMGHDEMTVAQGFSDEIGHGNGQRYPQAKGHTSEVRVNPISVEASAAACDAPVDNSALLLRMPLQPERVAEWIRLQERSRGCRSKVFASAPKIGAWLSLAVTGEELHEAYSLAKIDREVTKNPAPINLPFLDIFVQRVLSGRKVSRGEVGQAASLWHTTWEGLSAKAEELGVDPWNRAANEGFVEFQSRVLSAWRARSPAEVESVDG